MESSSSSWLLAYMQELRVLHYIFKDDNKMDCVSCLSLCCPNNKNNLGQKITIKDTELTDLNENAINVLKNSMKKGEK